MTEQKETKFTPAPWERGTGGTIIVQEPDDQVEALMIAAPKMYAMLSRIFECIEECGYLDDVLNSEINDLLAKARGEK